MNIQSVGHAGVTASPSSEIASPHADAHTTPAPVALPAVAPAPAESSQAADAAKLSQALARINQTMQKMSSGLEFSVDAESNRTVVKVVDQQTKELIRQMPSAEALEIAKAMDKVQGLLISLRA